MDADQFSAKFQALFHSVDGLLSRPDVAALLTPESAEQLARIRNFGQSWDDLAVNLSDEQKAQCFGQLEAAVTALIHTVAEFDKIQLTAIPVEQMGKA